MRRRRSAGTSRPRLPTAVVTGAAGFVGRHLVDVLRADGVEVVGVDRRLGVPRGATALRCDILDDVPAFAAALRRSDTVFHLAGAPGVREHGPAAAERRWRDNVLATRRVIELTPESTALIVTSSSSIYGGSAAGRPSREDDPLRPLSGYGWSKAAVEQLCRARLARGGRTWIARPFTVVGEGQRADMAVACWTAALLSGEPLQLFAPLDSSRDLTDVRDVCSVLSRLAELPGKGGVVNVGTGVGRTLGEIIATLALVTQTTPRLVVGPTCQSEPRATLADTGRLAALTGLRPATQLEAVLRRQVAAYATSSRERASLSVRDMSPEQGEAQTAQSVHNRRAHGASVHRR